MALGISSYGSVSSQSLSAFKSSGIQSEESKTNSFQEMLEKAANSGDDRELKSACIDFESYFIKTMFKEMRKTVYSEDSLIPKSSAEEMFQDMLDDEYSKNAANGKGMGLADYLYRQLSGGNANKIVKSNNTLS